MSLGKEKLEDIPAREQKATRIKWASTVLVVFSCLLVIFFAVATYSIRYFGYTGKQPDPGLDNRGLWEKNKWKW